MVRLSPQLATRKQPARAGSGGLARARGAYYTPEPVARWLAEHALLRALDDSRASELLVLDPACGDGALLIAALGFLGEHLASKAGPSGAPADAARARVEILGGIHGVDLDETAVRVARDALVRRALGTSDDPALEATARALVATRIRHGNALVGPDYVDDDAAEVRPFDFAAAFPRALRDGKPGFDVVLSNPPYGAAASAFERAYHARAYRHQGPKPDSYLLFLERFEGLLREGGALGVIVSNTWARSITLAPIRRHLAATYRFHRVMALPRGSFRAAVDAHALVLERAAVSSEGALVVDELEGSVARARHAIPWSALAASGEAMNLEAPAEALALVARVRSTSPRVADHCDVFNGLKPFERGKGVPPQTASVARARPFVREGARPDASWSPLLRGSLVRRYEVTWNDDAWVRYGPWLAAPRDPAIFAAPKLVVRQTGDRLVAALDTRGLYARNNLHLVLAKRPDVDLRVVLAILNSRLLDVVYVVMNPERGEALAEVKKAHVERLPLRLPDRTSARGARLAKALAAHVDARMARPSAADGAADERAIDALVLELYGIDPEELERTASSLRLA